MYYYSSRALQLLFIFISLCISNSFFWSKEKPKEKFNIIKEDENCKSTEHSFLELRVFENGESDNELVQLVNLSKDECFSNNKLGEIICPKLNKEVCDIFSSWGTIIFSCQDLQNGTDVYMVPLNRIFMWPTFEVGHKVNINHINVIPGKPIVLETISKSPRIFKLSNFFTEYEANKLIENTLSNKEEDFRLKRSTTGSLEFKAIDLHRTSENGFDTRSIEAMEIKKRSFNLLGIPKYDETWADGLQILRYNQTSAYIQHLDWIESVGNNHNFDSAGNGTNRYATILFYLSDVEEGGETVFTETSTLEMTSSSLDRIKETKEYLNSLNISHLFPETEWEFKMVSECRSKLAIKPVKLEAIMFYSQKSNGVVDRSSRHGACPIISGQKWAANLWVWNGQRNGYSKNSKNIAAVGGVTNVKATFESLDVEGVQLYWENKFWSDLIPNKKVFINTFVGHKWNVKINEEIVATYIIEKDKLDQNFILKSSDIKL